MLDVQKQSHVGFISIIFKHCTKSVEVTMLDIYKLKSHYSLRGKKWVGGN